MSCAAGAKRNLLDKRSSLFTNMSDNQTLYRINTDGRFLYIELMDELKEEKTFAQL